MRANPVTSMMKITIITLLIVLGIVSSGAQSMNLLPQQDPEFTRSLDGNWAFKYIPGTDPGADTGFSKPDFDVSGWKSIRVPGNWELQGFAEPGYDLKGLKEGFGLYRREFLVPEAWRAEGRRIFLRFEGVAYGFEAWVNGVKVGASSASAYNPSTFDITEALKPGGDAGNTLAVQVVTKPFAYEFDINDDWSLGGICRDVNLFSLPADHIGEFMTATKLADDGSAALSVGVTTSRAETEVRGRLIAPDGKTVSEFDLPRKSDGRCGVTVNVADPLLWTAETPSLYRLDLTLSSKGEALQKITRSIGLREISIKEGVLMLNGRPIKLHGVDHHDLDPVDGRAITEKEMRRDLDLMKKGNINFIRTSHYPPQPRFLELCDELGFYVMCEVSIGKGEEHMADPAYRDNIMARAEATVARDKNHPSVIVWSIGNENPITDLLLEAGHRAKEIDPTRPICYPTIGSYFDKNYEKFPEFVDIYSPHYPSVPTLRGYAHKLTRPVILTEYAHAWGLAADRIQDEWGILQETPGFAGGAIWHFMDQGILRTSGQPVDPSKPTKDVWTDPTHYYDGHNNDGTDGIVYSDRTPQFDFWETRKVYSPIQIAGRSAKVKSGGQDITLSVENRHDFRDLKGMTLAWSLQRNGAEIQKGDVPLAAKARGKETLRIPVTIPADASGDILTLDLRCTDEKGLQITERTLRLDLPETYHGAWTERLSGSSQPAVTENASGVEIRKGSWVLVVSKTSGELTIRDQAGRVLLAGLYPHPGRKLTMAETRNAKKAGTWQPSTLRQAETPAVGVTREGADILLSVSGTYPRPAAKQETRDKPAKKTGDPLLDQEASSAHQQSSGSEAFVGGYRARIAANGSIAVSYDYVPTNATGRLSEAGLSLAMPPGFTEFRWIGQGIYPGYPGKDRLDEFGIFHLNRDDLRFQGNRRETETALLTTPSGEGVAITMETPTDISVERDGESTLLSHNAVISGLGNKGSAPEASIDAEKTPHVAGSFTLVPLSNEWPEVLTRWFGKPSPTKEVFRPFYHSYDQ